MKTSKATVEANREEILRIASEGFRKHGFDGVRVADIMQAAGLSHGAFYTYFTSKDDLTAQACDASLKRQAERLKAATGDRRAALAAYFERYLSTKMRDVPEHACLFPSLAADVARQPKPVRTVFSNGVGDYLEALSVLTDEGEGRAQAIVTLSTLVGAMVLARAVEDEAVSDEIIATVRSALHSKYGEERN
ncbi:TetR/AcrR family transcriptional regulator [Asticcacaulis sp. 201]|uniref:TetR/AcrR family transcriptional regulator n=1 Tax=Asticcacaulis sp. 201 TaxID=3028787 RepID=UPI002916339D|nr:TetR/AcrR family transcriptional regulator [Asticcacaulis sp. 201]MDV6329653.1 TetR/AcrR family transcriptional regulator [Asticcacaulis sp. 201]